MKTGRVKVAIGFMIDKLLEWLGREVVYESLESMKEDVEDYIVKELLKAPEDIICDYGTISAKVFVDYVFDGKLWDAYEIGNEFLLEHVDPEDILGAGRKVSCLNELMRFKDALKSLIRVEVL
jgi:hypothetical protein